MKMKLQRSDVHPPAPPQPVNAAAQAPPKESLTPSSAAKVEFFKSIAGVAQEPSKPADTEPTGDQTAPTAQQQVDLVILFDDLRKHNPTYRLSSK